MRGPRKLWLTVLIGLSLCGSAKAATGQLLVEGMQVGSPDEGDFDAGKRWSQMENAGLHEDDNGDWWTTIGSALCEIKYEYSPWIHAINISPYPRLYASPHLPSNATITSIKVHAHVSDTSNRINDTDFCFSYHDGTQNCYSNVKSITSVAWGAGSVLTATWTANDLANLGVTTSMVNHPWFGGLIRGASNLPTPHPSSVGWVEKIVVEINYTY